MRDISLRFPGRKNVIMQQRREKIGLNPCFSSMIQVVHNGKRYAVREIKSFLKKNLYTCMRVITEFGYYCLKICMPSQETKQFSHIQRF